MIIKAILSVDHAGFFFFQGLQRPWLDYLLAWPTYLGDTKVLLVILIPLILWLDRKNSFRTIAALSCSQLVANYLSPLLKELIHRPRPHIYWENVHVIFSKPKNDAFPSGHTMVAFAAAAVLSYYYPKRAGWIYFAAAWVAITRVYVGAHYPSDLIGGAFFGFCCGWAVCRFFKYYEQPHA